MGCLVYKILFLNFLIISTNAYSSFKSEHYRYMGPNDLISILIQKFEPNLKHMTKDCLLVTPKNKYLIGSIDAIVGRPFYEKPSYGFVNWYGNCLLHIIYDHFKKLEDAPFSKELLSQYFSNHILKLIGPQAKTNIEVYGTPWDNLSLDFKRLLVKYWINKLIGPPEVIQDLGLNLDENALITTILSSLKFNDKYKSLISAAKNIAFLIAMRDEFLTY